MGRAASRDVADALSPAGTQPSDSTLLWAAAGAQQGPPGAEVSRGIVRRPVDPLAMRGSLALWGWLRFMFGEASSALGSRAPAAMEFMLMQGSLPLNLPREQKALDRGMERQEI
jgi:hypothetical protein